MSHEACPSEQQENANQPRLCASGCGFFANPACNDLCSKCYRERAAEHERMAAGSKTAAAALNASRMDIGKPDSPVLPAPVPAALEPQSVPEPIKADAQVAVLEKPAAAVSSSAAEDEVEKQAKKQKNQGRCACCSKKIGLASGFTCRCELRFCATHRYAEAHNCTFDYKAAGREQLAKNNPLVQASKVDRL